MKPLRNTVLALGAFLSVLALQDGAMSAEQSDAKGGTPAKSSSKSLAQTVEEIRNSINEGWRKLTSPKTVEPARDKVNEAYKELSDAAAAAVGSSDKPKKEANDKKDK
jgi:hypothetical protein